MRRWLLALGLGASVASCTRPATQLVVSVRSDVPPSRLQEVWVEVTPTDMLAEGPTATHGFTLLGRDGSVLATLPFSFGVVPPGQDASRRVMIVATARDRDGVAIVSRSVRTGFLPGQSLLLPLFLSSSCIARSCTEPDTTCDRGACVPIDVSPAALSPVEPGAELAEGDAGARPDAGASGCAPVPFTLQIPEVDLRGMSLSIREGAPLPLLVTVLGGDAFTTQFGLDLGTRVTGARFAMAVSAATETIEAVELPDGTTDIGVVTTEPTGVWSVALRGGGGPTTVPSFSSGTDVRLPPQGLFVHGTETWAAWSEDGAVSVGAFVGVASGGTLVGTQSGLLAGAMDLFAASGVRGILAVHATSAAACAAAVIDPGGGFVVGDTTVATGGDSCARPSIEQLSDGRVLVAWADTSGAARTIRYAILDSTLSLAVGPFGVGNDGRAGSTTPYYTPILAGLDGSAVLFWVQPGALTVAYARVGSDGRLGVVRTIDVSGATAEQLGSLRAARLGDALVPGWTASDGVHLGVVCDEP